MNPYPTASNTRKGLFWFILSLFVGVGNDALTKYLSQSIHPWQIIFLRLALGVALLFPLMLYKGSSAFRTNRLSLHIIRGMIFFMALYSWSYGVSQSPITTATIMSFTIPFFVLIFSPLFLHEKIQWQLWTATGIGFLGMLVTLYPIQWTLNTHSIFFLIATFLFASLDIINKKYVQQESMLCMLFYSFLTAALLTIAPASQHWVTPTTKHILMLLTLASGGKLILYFLLKAFSLTEASILQPARYIELVISILLGYLIFHDLPTWKSLLGSLLIVPCTLYILLHQPSSN